MAHIRQESRLCLVGLIGLFQGNTERFPLVCQLLHHFLSFGDVYEHTDISDRRTVRTARGFADSPVPAIPSVFRQETILDVIGLLPCIVGNRFVVFLQDALPVIRVQQVGPGFQFIRKVFRAVIAEHSSEFVAPVDSDHGARFIKIHCPLAGSQHFMNGVERCSFVLQCKVQSVVFLRLGDVDGHASELYRPAFRIPGQYALAAKPSDRAVLSAKAEIKARCAHGVFIEYTGGNMIEKSIPVFRVNAPQKGFHFIREIIPVMITHQPAETVTPVNRCQRAVRRKVDHPASRLC